MKLTLQGIREGKAEYESKGYKLPSFDYETVKKHTYERPEWIDFDAGNIFRAFQANVMQNPLNSGICETGLIAAEGYDYEIIEKRNGAHDNLSRTATLKGSGSVEKTVIDFSMKTVI